MEYVCNVCVMCMRVKAVGGDVKDGVSRPSSRSALLVHQFSNSMLVHLSKIYVITKVLRSLRSPSHRCSIVWHVHIDSRRSDCPSRLLWRVFRLTHIYLGACMSLIQIVQHDHMRWTMHKCFRKATHNNVQRFFPFFFFEKIRQKTYHSSGTFLRSKKCGIQMPARFF